MCSYPMWAGNRLWRPAVDNSRRGRETIAKPPRGSLEGLTSVQMSGQVNPGERSFRIYFIDARVWHPRPHFREVKEHTG